MVHCWRQIDARLHVSLPRGPRLPLSSPDLSSSGLLASPRAHQSHPTASHSVEAALNSILALAGVSDRWTAKRRVEQEWARVRARVGAQVRGPLSRTVKASDHVGVVERNSCSVVVNPKRGERSKSTTDRPPPHLDSRPQLRPVSAPPAAPLHVSLYSSQLAFTPPQPSRPRQSATRPDAVLPSTPDGLPAHLRNAGDPDGALHRGVQPHLDERASLPLRGSRIAADPARRTRCSSGC